MTTASNIFIPYKQSVSFPVEYNLSTNVLSSTFWNSLFFKMYFHQHFGFQGVSKTGDVTTIGRGGSDATDPPLPIVEEDQMQLQLLSQRYLNLILVKYILM